MNFQWILNDFGEVAACVAEDFLEPLSYAAAGVLPALAAAALWTAAAACIRGGKWSLRRAAARIFFCLYVYVVIWQAFLSRESGSRTGVDLALLSTWKASAQSKAYVLENVLMFIPMGVILPLVWKKGRNPAVCVLTGAVCSALIEGLQYLTSRGHCQTDDLVMNTLGTLIGWGLAAALGSVCGIFNQKQSRKQL